MKKKGPPTWVKQIQALYPEFPEFTDVNKAMYAGEHRYCTTPLGFVLSELSFLAEAKQRHAALWVLMDAGADPNLICDTQWPYEDNCEEVLWKPMEMASDDDDVHILIRYGAVIPDDMECEPFVHQIYDSHRRAMATRWCCCSVLHGSLHGPWADIADLLVNVLMY